MDWVLPGSPAHGILQAITLERVAKAFSGAFPAQGLDLALLRHRWACYPLSLRESPLCPTQIASSLFLRAPCMAVPSHWDSFPEHHFASSCILPLHSSEMWKLYRTDMVPSHSFMLSSSHIYMFIRCQPNNTGFK